MIVGCAAALLVCLCAGMVGAMILADRYGMDARRWVVTAVPTPAELGEPIGGRAPALAQPVEQVTLTGKIAIPEGSSLSARELHVITNHGEAAVNERGAFVTQAVRGDQATTLVIAANAQGNGVFLRTSRGSQTLAETEMSARSTARALVLYDLAILTLPAEYADRAESLVESLPDFARLVAAVEDAIRADPDDPLGVEAHEDLYRLAARLTQALLWQSAAT